MHHDEPEHGYRRHYEAEYRYSREKIDKTAKRQAELQELRQEAEKLMQSGARVYVDETNLKLFYEYGANPNISTVPIDRGPERPHCEMTLTQDRIKVDKDK